MRTKHILTVAVLAVAVSAAGAGAITAFDGGDGTVAAQNAGDGTANASAEPDRRIHVSATGEVQAEPDQAVVRVAVRAHADSVDEVRTGLANGSDDLTDALDELDVEYETTRYDISQQRQPGPRERRQPEPDERQPELEYEGTHAYEITADDPGLAGDVVDAAAEAGTTVESATLTLSDQRREQVRDTAIENAIGDANNQSETIAEAGGLEVVAPVSIDASQQRFVPAPFESAQADDGAAPPTEIAAGMVTVSYEVDVSYEAVRN